MTYLEKFDQLVERVRKGMACETGECMGKDCPYYDGECDLDYRDDIMELLKILCLAAADYKNMDFGKKEYVE